MSAAAGAPPPPPPPPRNSFRHLPTELILNIIEYLDFDDYANLTLAIYAILQFHGLAPPMSVEIYERITAQPTVQDRSIGFWGPGRRKTFFCLPYELRYHIISYLDPADRIAWLLSHVSIFRGYFFQMSDETKRTLWDAIQPPRKK